MNLWHTPPPYKYIKFPRNAKKDSLYSQKCKYINNQHLYNQKQVFSNPNIHLFVYLLIILWNIRILCLRMYQKEKLIWLMHFLRSFNSSVINVRLCYRKLRGFFVSMSGFWFRYLLVSQIPMNWNIMLSIKEILLVHFILHQLKTN